MPDENDQIEAWHEKFWQAAMETAPGRFVVAELLDLCGSRSPRYLYDGDALGAAKRDGKAEIGDHVESQLEKHCADRFVQMIRERRARLGRLRKAQQDEEAPKRERVQSLEEMADRQMTEESAKAKSKDK